MSKQLSEAIWGQVVLQGPENLSRSKTAATSQENRTKQTGEIFTNQMTFFQKHD